MTKNFRDTLNKELQNPDFKEEWDSLEPEFQIIKSIIESSFSIMVSITDTGKS